MSSHQPSPSIAVLPAVPPPVVTRLVPSPRGPHQDEVAVQGSLALELPRIEHWSGPALSPDALSPDALSHRPVTESSRVTGSADAELREWSTRFAQATVEAVAGQRPVGQLLRWTSRTVYRDLERRVRLVTLSAPTGTPARTSIRPQVVSVHLCRPDVDVAEASVHVRHGRRSRALALRLERRKGRWLCTAMEFS